MNAFLRPDLRHGVLICIVLAALSARLASLDVFSSHGLGWLPLAIVLGMVAGNLWPALAKSGAAGLTLARGTLMRAGIALYGLKLGFSDLSLVGWQGVLLALAMVSSTLLLARLLGRRLGLDPTLALLIGAGSAICGAAAVAAADGVLSARARQVASAVAAVVICGTLAMYLMPLLLPLTGLSDARFGMWIGLTVHELGHVVAAATMVGPDAASTALVEKMLRVMLLAPAMLWIALQGERVPSVAGARVRVPVFLWVFLGLLALNLGGAVPASWRQSGALLADALLAVGLVALGMVTRVADVRAAGLKVWALALILWAYLLLAGFGLIRVVAQ
ncbi:MAG: putative sulfate exporter family transporter [Proteobacteria bacterium]|nr:putative sulfate exporter family transporter [Pseudomonadota bacterium]